MTMYLIALLLRPNNEFIKYHDKMGILYNRYSVASLNSPIMSIERIEG